MKRISKITAALILSSSALLSADLFSLKITNTTNSENYNFGGSSLIDVIENFDNSNLSSKSPNYNETDNLTSILDMRGLPVTLNLTGTTATFSVPSLGITKVFTGNTRDDSIDALEDWFKKDGASILERIMKELAKVSPVDPIAGNSNSAMAKNVESDFTNGFLNTASKQKQSNTQVDENNNTITIAPTYKSLEVDGKSSDSYTLPLSYAFVSDDDSNKKLSINLPISYTDVEGAKTYSFGLGLDYSLPINNKWTLTPAINYTTTGSADLATLAQIGGASLTSSYTFTLPNTHRLSVGNMIGYYTTLKFYSNDYAYDPGITNTVFRNGLMYSMDTDNIVNNTSLDLFAVNTKYTGTELYNDSYNEVGFSFGYNKVNVNLLSDNKKYAYRKNLKVGASYLSSDKEKGFKINFGLTF